MTWSCAAITNGVTFLPNGKISPCCMIDEKYSKDISEIKNTDRFADLLTDSSVPKECRKCTTAEENNIPSYRQHFNSIAAESDKLQFIDIRNSNLCNLSCRTCGPHASSTWAIELELDNHITKQDLTENLDLIVNDAVQEIYFTGGEPLLNLDHWNILDQLVKSGQSKNVTLRYNSNLTVLKYKDKNLLEYWKNFKQINFTASIDAVGEKLNSLRSGTDWNRIKNNVDKLVNYKNTLNNLNFEVAVTVSNLNIWFLTETINYFKELHIEIQFCILEFPDYFSLGCLPIELINFATAEIDRTISLVPKHRNVLIYAKNQITSNINQHLFLNTLANVLLLDKLRGEKLFDYLPFKKYAVKQIINNNG